MRRIAETPTEFLAEPRIGAAGMVHVAALVADLLHSAGAGVAHQALTAFETDQADQRNRLMLTAVAVWLLADAWVGARSGVTLLTLLDGTIRDLAASGPALAFIEQAERREELARTTLTALNLLPAGEDLRQAADRLSAVSATEDRARLVREALVRKAAEESADKFTRE